MGNDRNVLVIKRSLLFSSNYARFNGFVGCDMFSLPAFKPLEDNLFYDKAKAETDSKLKQIIPYVVLQCEGDILAYTRTSDTGEQRLAEKVSIGLGGHIEISDRSHHLMRTIILAAAREVKEELEIPLTKEVIHDCLVPVGYVNDDIDEVGSVHFGVVFRLPVSREVRDKIESAPQEHISSIAWSTPHGVSAVAKNLESWSRLVLPYFMY